MESENKMLNDQRIRAEEITQIEKDLAAKFGAR